nr:MAG TPA: hypothetical protein [Caudoviricetes sp.]
MTPKDSEYIRTRLKTLDNSHLMTLKLWLKDRVGQESQDKLELVNLEIERREKLRKYYEY